MKILNSKTKNFDKNLDYLLFKRRKSIKSDKVSVTNIINDVKKNGDKALIKYEKKFNRNSTIIPSAKKITKLIKSLNPKVKKAIETACSDLRNSLKGTDVEDLKKKTQDLVQASMKLGEAIYKSQQSAKPDDGAKDKKEEGKKDDNVVDADFEEVKDENKEKSA